MIPFERFLTALRQRAGTGEAGPIGLDLAAERMSLVQMQRAADGPALRAVLSTPYPCAREALVSSPAAFRSFLRHALAARPFRGRQVVSCLPPGELRIVHVELRPAEGEGEAEAVVRAATERLGEPLDDCVLDFIPIRRAEGAEPAREAIVAVAKRARVLEYLDLLRGAGLEPVALDIGPGALARLVGAMDRDRSHPNVLLVNFGRTRSFLTVIWGRRLMLDREIDFGEDALVAALGEQLELPAHLALRMLQTRGFAAGGGGEDADLAAAISDILRPAFTRLAQEVEKTLIYVASRTHGNSVEQLSLLGSAARYPGVDRLVGGLVEIPVAVLNPLGAFAALPDAGSVGDGDPLPGVALATGLALRGMTHA